MSVLQIKQRGLTYGALFAALGMWIGAQAIAEDTTGGEIHSKIVKSSGLAQKVQTIK